MRTRNLVALAVTVTLASAAVLVGSLDRDGDGSTPAPVDPVPTTTVPPPQGLALPAGRQPEPVLDAPEGGRTVPAAVRQRLARLLADRDLGRSVGVLVRDLDDDRDVLSVGADAVFTPASTLKLFTAAAALSVLGPEHRFRTTVVLDRSGPGPPRVVLVGGGDPLLARTQHDPSQAYAPDVSTVASVDRLAGLAAGALRRTGVDRVRVGWDASLFGGPAVSPQWESSYALDEVSPISALWVDEGRLGWGYADRSPDPAAAAAGELVGRLERRGIAVVGAPRPGVPAGGAREIAGLDSAPLDEIVEHVLEVSDNDGAEVLLRHVGLATGRSGSFAGGTAGVRETLTGLGVPWRRVVVHDGSGLSRHDRVTLDAELAVLQLGTDPELPDLRTVVTGLPVARFSGNLAYRFVDAGTAAGRGVVRAKTGTLTGVHGLTGTVVTRDDALLGFALLADRVRPRDTLDARDTLDRLAAALAGCGCDR